MSRTILGVCTMFGSTDEVRFKLAIEFLKEAKRLGYYVIRCDKSTKNPEVRETMRGLAGLLVEINNELATHGDQQRMLFKSAYDLVEKGDAFVYLQPEKVGVLQHIGQITMPIFKERQDIVIPTRSPQSKLSLPAFQAQGEWVLSDIFTSETGLRGLDVGFGITAMSRNALSHFVDADPRRRGIEDDRWVEYVGLIRASRDSTISFAEDPPVIEFLYPPEQKAEEEDPNNTAIRQKRADQVQVISRHFREA